MATSELARRLLAVHGVVESQPVEDWAGEFPLPPAVEQFYRQVGPVGVTIESYGNPFYLPRLSDLWEFQAGYRWNGLTGERIPDWDDDWLVVAGDGGDPFIFSRATNAVLHAVHGAGVWEPGELFPDLNTMAACLGQLSAVVVEASTEFTDDDCRIRPEHHDEAVARLQDLLGSKLDAEFVLARLGWG